jgi:hypothetical protein
LHDEIVETEQCKAEMPTACYACEKATCSDHAAGRQEATCAEVKTEEEMAEQVEEVEEALKTAHLPAF